MRHILLLALLTACSGAPVSPTDAGPGHDAHLPPGVDGGPQPMVDGGPITPGELPAGWLYTEANHILVSDGHGGGTAWMGRGVNVDDIYFCGFNNTLWLSDPGPAFEAVLEGAITTWHATFLRLSLSMASNATFSNWLDDAAADTYRTPMTHAIRSVGTHPGVYVMVTVRSDASMIGQDEVHGDPEATGLPSDSTTTPDSTAFPTGTDALYIALVDAFANDGFVLFGLTNEPGGNLLEDQTIVNAMRHAVGVIRAEEDRLGVPHHIVSVQGQGWTSDISFYAATPPAIAEDNVVYEVHGYPPQTDSYTYSNIPVVIGEYGSLDDSAAFFADLEAKQIPNLAWDFEPFSDCGPDLLQVTRDESMLDPTAWGTTVQAYLAAHAP